VEGDNTGTGTGCRMVAISVRRVALCKGPMNCVNSVTYRMETGFDSVGSVAGKKSVDTRVGVVDGTWTESGGPRTGESAKGPCVGTNLANSHYSHHPSSSHCLATNTRYSRLQPCLGFNVIRTSLELLKGAEGPRVATRLGALEKS
jgi:hypothetical protein